MVSIKFGETALISFFNLAFLKIPNSSRLNLIGWVYNALFGPKIALRLFWRKILGLPTILCM